MTSKQTTKLTKSQQALYERIKAGEKFWKNWLGHTFHDDNMKGINYLTIEKLKALKLIKVVRRDRFEYLELDNNAS